MVFALLFCWVVIPTNGVSSDVPYVLWLKNNKRMTVKAPPDCKGKRCLVTLLNGEVTSLPASMLDLTRSETFNREAAEQREARRLARLEAERLKANQEAKELEMNKSRRIVLKPGTELPKYERPEDSAAVATDAESKLIGEPTVADFTSNQPVYISREVISKYSDHYLLACTVLNEKLDEAKDVKIVLTVNFADAPSQTITKTVNRPLKKGESATLTYKLSATDDILRTNYQVEATTVKQVYK